MSWLRSPLVLLLARLYLGLPSQLALRIATLQAVGPVNGTNPVRGAACPPVPAHLRPSACTVLVRSTEWLFTESTSRLFARQCLAFKGRSKQVGTTRASTYSVYLY
ncbi:hypothetical protein V8C37DRAFT_365594 [Trichoderma ceciliae]